MWIGRNNKKRRKTPIGEEGFLSERQGDALMEIIGALFGESAKGRALRVVLASGLTLWGILPKESGPDRLLDMLLSFFK